MKKNITLLFCLSLAFSMLIAQDMPFVHHSIQNRGNGQAEEIHSETQAEYEKYVEWMQENVAARPTSPNTVYNIPIIVHVIHNGEPYGVGSNISYPQIMSQIIVLNEDFNRQNADTINTPAAFKSLAANCNINFCLVPRDTFGNILAEAGVDRIDRNSLGLASPPYDLWGMVAMKNARYWSTDKYMNIWVCDLSDFPSYAEFSNSGLNDGVVVSYTSFGSYNKFATPQLLQGSPFNLGRQATQMTAFWLGLKMIWGGGNCGSDLVADTPTQQQANQGCPTFPHITCNNGPNGDMFSNFMDWSDESCQNIFTLGQKAVMINSLNTIPKRNAIATSTICSLTSGIEPKAIQTGKVYPNPNEGNFTFELNNTQAKQAELTLCNLHGQTVLTKNVSVANGSVKENIETAHLASGTYLLKVNAEGRTAHYKVIIAK